MSVTLVMVQSLDAKTTHTFSKEDRTHFEKIRNGHTVVVMGRLTYESANIIPTPGKLRIVMTKNPNKFTSIPGQLEFTKDSPEDIVRKHPSILLTGGSQINTLFFEQKLINECYITLEPRIFGWGNNLIAPTHLDISLELLDQKQINKQGTLVLHYRVHYDH